MTTLPIGLITRLTGKDGSYLAEFLLEKEYEVHGIKRRASSLNTQRVDHIYKDHTQLMLSHINVGTGVDCTIRELAETIAEVTGFKGSLVFDKTKPDGTPRKLLDTSRLTALGWQPEIDLKQGLQMAYDWFVDNQDAFRGQAND